MIVTGIDPGPGDRGCGWVDYDDDLRRVTLTAGERTTFATLAILREWVTGGMVAIEDVDPRGMPLGRDMIATLKLLGRMQEIAPDATWIGRGAVKLALCGSSRANDSNVRAALVALFARWHGLDERAVIGRKASPGPLYGVSKHAWPALGVAVVAAHGVEVAQLARATA